jgi:cob(I)alamin adenosyltransferase
MTCLQKGYVHLYTGNGKGKTTAALGLALRAAGAGLRVYIVQFAKGSPTGELTSLDKFKGVITVRQFGRRSFIRGRPSPADFACAARGMAAAARAVAEGRYDVVVLDEICGACRCNLVRTEKVLEALEKRHKGVEVVMTGRNAPEELVGAADLITEMKEVKHYFINGVKARKGIEF